MKVSIGVPIRNSEGMLESCLDCLLRQSHKDFEIILSDNGSTDRTPEICNDYAARDERIRVVRHDPGLSIRGNFEYVLAQAKHDFFCWRADDDTSDDFFLEKLLALLDEYPDAGVAMGCIHDLGHGGDVEIWLSPEMMFTDPVRVMELLASDQRIKLENFYGLWRTSYLRDKLAGVFAAYPQSALWGVDALLQFATAIRLEAVFTDATVFYKTSAGTQVRRSRIRLAHRSKVSAAEELHPASLKGKILLRPQLKQLALQFVTKQIEELEYEPAVKQQLQLLAETFVASVIPLNKWRMARWKVRAFLSGVRY